MMELWKERGAGAGAMWALRTVNGLLGPQGRPRMSKIPIFSVNHDSQQCTDLFIFLTINIFHDGPQHKDGSKYAAKKK